MKEMFIRWCEHEQIELDLTRNQSIFLDFLLEHPEKVAGIGDMWTPIRILQQFINR